MPPPCRPGGRFRAHQDAFPPPLRGGGELALEGACLDSRVARALGVASFVLLDLVAPLALPLWALRVVAAKILADPDRTVAAPLFVQAGDPNGQAWFYWWFHRAITLGLPVERPDVVCAPDGIELGANFATRVDAWLAFPFFDRLPFPASFNAVAMAVPVVSAWCAWLGLRALGAAPPVALCGGLVLGFSDYALFEVSLGHNANALVGPVILLLGAGAAVAEGRIHWTPVAAAAGVLTLQAYPPYALAVAPVLALFFAIGVATPRRRAALAGGALMALVVLPAAAMQVSSLRARGFVHEGAGILRQNWSTLVADSLPWDWLARADAAFNDHHTWVAPAVLFGAAGALAGGARGFAWLAGAAWFWVLSLGVVLAEREGAELTPIRDGGRLFVLPLAWTIEQLPTLVGVRAYRFAPLVAAAAVFALAEGSRRQGRLLRFVLPAVATLVLAHGLHAARGLRFTTQTWTLPAAITWLAEEPGDFAIYELPAGMGHASAALQVVHQKRRSEGHHDVSPAVRTPPRDCYTTAFGRDLWALDRGQERAEDPGIEEAISAGYRYIVVYRWPYRQAKREARLREVLRDLRAGLGEPVKDDGEVVIFALPAAP